VSTRCAQEKRADDDGWQLAASRWLRDLVEEVALVAHARREQLLRVHRFRLRHEDLEDCYSQATLELLARARRGVGFKSRLHAANALELRFLSRVRDRRRALSGRSPMQAALEEAVVLAGCGETDVEVVDRAANVEALVLLRHELRTIGKLAKHLSADQKLVLSSQLSGETCAEFCTRTGWSSEKYRKVAQRARARLRATDAEC
jgi:DNA-directed RNA polymerase specialized sigma24 family protein